jgi:DNA gyrase/topoisomerase IV subunit A
MFDTLSDRLSGILDKITGRGALSDADVEDALREVRRALLEADVALEVVKTFTDKVREKAVGAEIVKSVKPGQMVVTITRDGFIKRTPLVVFRAQNRGGRGRSAAGTRGDDIVTRSFNGHTHQWVLFFSSLLTLFLTSVDLRGCPRCTCRSFCRRTWHRSS